MWAPACHVVMEHYVTCFSCCHMQGGFAVVRVVISIKTVPVIAQALTAEQILAQYGTLPDQHHELSAQHVLASQHMHMQQGNNTGQQA